MSWVGGGGGSPQGGGKPGNEDDEYDYDYADPIAAVPSTAGPGAQNRMMTGAGRLMTGQQQPPQGQGMRMMTGQVPGSRMGTAGGTGGGDLRPMTSVSGAGYTSAKGGPGAKSFDPLGQRGAAPPLAEKADNSPTDLAREMEKAVHRLMEKSAEASRSGNDHAAALELAKDAMKKERALCKHREATSLSDQINMDLTYAVSFNLAQCHEKTKNFDTALQAYGLLVKNKQYPQSGRLRVNMGNIYFEQKKFPQAIKMYRMALDQIPTTGKEIRFKIFRNIGNAFVKMGQFQDAVPSYETIMGGNPDFHTGFNLILCYLALGDAEKMKRGFAKLLTIPIGGNNGGVKGVGDGSVGVSGGGGAGDELDDMEDDDEEAKKADALEAVGARRDGLRSELKRRKREAQYYILTAARLVTPQLDKQEWAAGYEWAIEALKPDHESIASELEIDMALMHLKRRDFDKAIAGLKMFEKKDQQHRAMAATNLSFCYFLEQEYAQAEKYADLAYTNDRYNAKALVNKGNCLLVKGDLEMAKQFYLEAIGVEADCVEAIYNLGLVNIKMGSYQEAQQAFEKLHTIIPHNPEVIYQIASLHETTADLHSAIKWFHILRTRVPSDPLVLAKMGQIFNKQEDESQAFHYHLESYQHYPVSLDVISWLGVWYVKSELYEKAIHFFDRAAQIQPDEVKWQLMVTSCYRRMHNYQKALELYEQIHAAHPDNLECLRYLVAICKDLGRPHEVYQQKLSRLDRAANMQAGTTTRIGGGARGGGGEGGEGGCGCSGGGGGGAGGRGGALGRAREGGSAESAQDGAHGEFKKGSPFGSAQPSQPASASLSSSGGSRELKRGGRVEHEDEDDFADTDVGDMLPGM